LEIFEQDFSAKSGLPCPASQPLRFLIHVLRQAPSTFGARQEASPEKQQAHASQTRGGSQASPHKGSVGEAHFCFRYLKIVRLCLKLCMAKMMENKFHVKWNKESKQTKNAICIHLRATTICK